MDHQDPRQKCSPWGAGMDMELALRRATSLAPYQPGAKTWRISPWRWRPTVAMSTDKKETEGRKGAETAAKSPWALGDQNP
ncbi:hypothetical protein CU103_22060 [Phyllobacterium sophorae]|uniref:Uncharacterized protein n=1 Tax=Phyllobacterium sophorae TaxID=1520277 RepID=A0A2P7B4W5_9HYPH|nr:hypothetical protein CU103_22060 [Phyllobacterium sophorae]